MTRLCILKRLSYRILIKLAVIHLQHTVHGIIESNIKTNIMVNDGQIFVYPGAMRSISL